MWLQAWEASYQGKASWVKKLNYKQDLSPTAKGRVEISKEGKKGSAPSNPESKACVGWQECETDPTSPLTVSWRQLSHCILRSPARHFIKMLPDRSVPCKTSSSLFFLPGPVHCPSLVPILWSHSAPVPILWCRKDAALSGASPAVAPSQSFGLSVQRLLLQAFCLLF